MKKKRLILFGLIIGLAIGLFGGIYVYKEYLGEDPVSNSDKSGDPIINEKLRAVVTKKTVRKIGDAQKIVLDFTDLDDEKKDQLTINYYYGQTIKPGDTLTKDKGEKMILVYQKDGNIATVPID